MAGFSILYPAALAGAPFVREGREPGPLVQRGHDRQR